MSNNISPEIKQECREFLADHYQAFEAFPIEFECDNKLYSFDEYMAWFSDEELEAIKNSVDKSMTWVGEK